MMDLIFHKLVDPQFLFTLMVAVATAATIITLGMTFVEGDNPADMHQAFADALERSYADIGKPTHS